jgi:hypothetical protein
MIAGRGYLRCVKGDDVPGLGVVIIGRIAIETANDQFFSVGVESVAAASRAARKGSGNVRPRAVARRRIPAHAFALKKYFGGTFSSKVCDNEHATATLGDSKILSVKNSPRDVTRPAFSKCGEDCCKISSRV